MKARRILSVCVGAVSLCAPWSSGCGGRVDSVEVQQQPPASPDWPTSPPPETPPAKSQPPPISGGTLLVLKDGHTAVAADSEQDRVWIVDLATQTVLGDVVLQPGDEPGRVVEDAAGRVHVVLRRGGAIASIDPQGGSVTRRAVCPAPRGIAYDAAHDAILVACADGLLATFPAAGGDATRAVRLDGDLRDVIVQNGVTYVSRFRAAELLALAADGTIAQRITLPAFTSPSMSPPNGITTAVPSVAYRTVPVPGGGLLMLHQRAQADAVSTMPGGYSDFGMCGGGGIVHDAMTLITPGTAPPIAAPLMQVMLAVDVAVSPDGSEVALAMPGSKLLGISVGTLPMSSLQAPQSCALPLTTSQGLSAGQAIAVAFDGQGRLVAQTRDPATINVGGVSIPLPSPGLHSDGLDTFYTGTKGGIACASCHPEGGDDGRVWQFEGLGPRRTQNLRGGVLARAPFHWSGDIADMNMLASVVFEGRMIGPTLSEQQISALGEWMDALPALTAPAPADPQPVARGRQIFADPSVGCASCHSGPQLSNRQLLDVGTGGVFKVPSLVGIRYRAPYLHDGCAATLLDRFGDTCGGGEQHGHTAQLGAGQLADLVAYLESL